MQQIKKIKRKNYIKNIKAQFASRHSIPLYDEDIRMPLNEFIGEPY